MRSDLRTAVIGCGYFGAKHAAKFAARSNLICVADEDYSAACRLADKVKTGDCWFRSNTKGVVIDDIDAVSICTPASTHYEIAKGFLNRGVHVLVEKPMATDHMAACTLENLAAQKGLVLQPGHIERFSPGFKKIRDAIVPGEKFYLRSSRLCPYSKRGRDVSVVMDLMIHDIDIALTLADSAPLRISANGTTETCWAAIKFEDDSVATLEACRLASRKKQAVLVEQGNEVLQTSLECAEDILDLEIASFLDAVSHGRKPFVTASEGAEAVRVAREIERLIHP